MIRKSSKLVLAICLFAVAACHSNSQNQEKTTPQSISSDSKIEISKLDSLNKEVQVKTTSIESSIQEVESIMEELENL